MLTSLKQWIASGITSSTLFIVGTFFYIKGLTNSRKSYLFEKKIVSKWYFQDYKQHELCEWNDFCKSLNLGDILQIQLSEQLLRNSFSGRDSERYSERYSERDSERDSERYSEIVKRFECWALCIQVGNEPMVIRHLKQDVNCQDGYAAFKIPLSDFWGKDMQIRINNSRDKITKPKDCKQIIRSADAVLNGLDDEPFLHSFLPSKSYFVEYLRYPKSGEFCSPWFQARDFSTIWNLALPGDMIQFKRKLGYSHWAIYTDKPSPDNDYKVLLHRSSSDSLSLINVVNATVSVITLSSFSEVEEGCWVRINNSWDAVFSPKRNKSICDFATQCIDKSFLGNYNIRNNNCWHFVMHARYGEDVVKFVNLFDPSFKSESSLIKSISEGRVISFSRRQADGSPPAPARAFHLETTSTVVVHSAQKREEVAFHSMSFSDFKRNVSEKFCDSNESRDLFLTQLQPAPKQTPANTKQKHDFRNMFHTCGLIGGQIEQLPPTPSVLVQGSPDLEK